MRLSVECAFPYLRKRGAVSRKSAFCAGGLTEKHTLGGWGHGKAHSRWRPHGKAQSGWEQSYRVRLSVTPNPRMRLSVECAFPYLRKRGAISRRSAFWVGGLTGKRILEGWGHGKAHSAILRSRKLRFSVTLPPRRRGVQPPAKLRGTMKNGSTGKMRSSNRPPGCGAVCSRICKFGLEFDFTKSRSLGAQF